VVQSSFWAAEFQTLVARPWVSLLRQRKGLLVLLAEVGIVTELEIPTSNWAHVDAPPSWWENFFYSCGDWQEVQRVLKEDWNAEAVPSSRLGEVGTIVFENEQDATMFMLRWT
jgi:hypothetical protein